MLTTIARAVSAAMSDSGVACGVRPTTSTEVYVIVSSLRLCRRLTTTLGTTATSSIGKAVTLGPTALLTSLASTFYFGSQQSYRLVMCRANLIAAKHATKESELAAFFRMQLLATTDGQKRSLTRRRLNCFFFNRVPFCNEHELLLIITGTTVVLLRILVRDQAQCA